MITQKQVKELFNYQNGYLVRSVDVGRKVKAGAIVGTDCGNGYKRVKIDGKLYLIHRLVFLYHYGFMPENDIDHIDRDKLNNRIENLREVSSQCNLRNTGNYSSNSSGVKGVSYETRSGKYRASVMVSGRSVKLGYYSDFTEAVAHRLAAEQCIGWSDCNSSSPAFRYIQDYKMKIESEE